MPSEAVKCGRAVVPRQWVARYEPGYPARSRSLLHHGSLATSRDTRLAHARSYTMGRSLRAGIPGSLTLAPTPWVARYEPGYPARSRSLLELLDGHEHGAGLGALGRTDHSAPFEEVHEASGAGEADAELALQHAGGSKAAPHHELHGLVEQIVGIGRPVVMPRAAGRVVARDALDVARRRHLAAPVRDDLPHAFLVDPGPLDPDCPAGARGQQQHVALADELLGAGLVEDHPRVGQAAHREREPARHVGLDDTGDHVHRGSLGSDHEVNPHGARHLRDAADTRLHVACRDHHEVV